MAIVKNQIGGHAGTVDLGNTVYSFANLSSNTSLETVTGVAITAAMGSGDWIIYMGNTLVWQTYANTTFLYDFSALGATLNQNILCTGNSTYPTGTITLKTVGSQSSIALRIAKYGYNTAGV
jgi:hypothetical protein